MKRLLSVLLVLLLLIGSAPSASANSAQSYWEGIDRAGVIITDGESPIEVVHELLTFDVQEFPQNYYGSEDELLAYTGKVTAQYTFYNPSDISVTAKLLFPFGQLPYYIDPYNPETGEYNYDVDSQKYDILIDGSPIEKTIRYTLYGFDEFDLMQNLSTISDSFAKDPFYYPDLPVTKYVFSPSGIEESAFDECLILSFEIPKSTTDQRFYLYDTYNAETLPNGNTKLSTFLYEPDDIVLYVFGTPLAEAPEWKVEIESTSLFWETYKEIPGTAILAKTEEMTFQSFALSNWSEESGVSEIDWYNATVSDMYTDIYDTFEESSPCVEPLFHSWNFENYLMRWYEYEITVEPGQRIVNSVTAPIYPSINLDYEPDVYGYTYLLSPAQTWKSFGTLEIVVNTPFYITESSLEGFEKTETGYELTRPGLPDSELTFTLSTSENPEKPKTNFFYSFLYGVAFSSL